MTAAAGVKPAARRVVKLPSAAALPHTVRTAMRRGDFDGQVRVLIAAGKFREAEKLLPWADLAAGPITEERVVKLFGSVRAFLDALAERVHSTGTDKQRSDRHATRLHKRVHAGMTPADYRRQRPARGTASPISKVKRRSAGPFECSSRRCHSPVDGR